MGLAHFSLDDFADDLRPPPPRGADAGAAPQLHGAAPQLHGAALQLHPFVDEGLLEPAKLAHTRKLIVAAIQVARTNKKCVEKENNTLKLFLHV